MASSRNIVTKRRDILEGLISFGKKDSQNRKKESQDMATCDGDGYYNDVVKEWECPEEKGEKS